jgi:hypothetical protein
LLAYRETDEQLLAAITPPAAVIPQDQFHPRGVVFGPDGLLYISNVPNPVQGLGGQVLRYHPDTGAFDIFVDEAGGPGQLNRPEGLVFDPGGLLYITSFSADPTAERITDTDSIRIYGGDGVFVDKIDLDQVGQPRASRAFAQALLFGPGGSLFVPINNTGAVRRYDVSLRPFTFTNFVVPSAQGGPLGQPWYLTFGETDPGTLEYNSQTD